MADFGDNAPSGSDGVRDLRGEAGMEETEDVQTRVRRVLRQYHSSIHAAASATSDPLMDGLRSLEIARHLFQICSPGNSMDSASFPVPTEQRLQEILNVSAWGFGTLRSLIRSEFRKRPTCAE